MTPQQADVLFWLLARATGIASFLALFIAILSGIALRTSVLDWLGTNRALKALHTFSTVLWIPLGLSIIRAASRISTLKAEECPLLFCAPSAPSFLERNTERVTG